MAEKINYDAVIGELEAERARAVTQAAAPFDSAISALKKLKARAASDHSDSFVAPLLIKDQPTNGHVAVVLGGEQTPRRFAGMSLADAAETYLRSMNRPLTSREIADGLKANGIESKSEKFLNLVYTRLYLSKDRFKRHNDKWFLKDWPLALGVGG